MSFWLKCVVHSYTEVFLGGKQCHSLYGRGAHIVQSLVHFFEMMQTYEAKFKHFLLYFQITNSELKGEVEIYLEKNSKLYLCQNFLANEQYTELLNKYGKSTEIRNTFQIFSSKLASPQ